MDIWGVHALVYIFGYVTCKTFYFLNTTRISLKLIKSSRIIYLLMAVKAIENYITSERMMKRYMKESSRDLDFISDFEKKFQEEITNFKTNAIENLIAHTPDAFRPGLDFEDWNSAMVHLQRHEAEALQFWRMSKWLIS